MFEVLGGTLANALPCVPTPCSLGELMRATGIVCPWDKPEAHRVLCAPSARCIFSHSSRVNLNLGSPRVAVPNPTFPKPVTSCSGIPGAGAGAAVRSESLTVRSSSSQFGAEPAAVVEYVSPLAKHVRQIAEQLDAGNVDDAQNALLSLLQLFNVKKHKEDRAFKPGSRYGADTHTQLMSEHVNIRSVSKASSLMVRCVYRFPPPVARIT